MDETPDEDDDDVCGHGVPFDQDCEECDLLYDDDEDGEDDDADETVESYAGHEVRS